MTDSNSGISKIIAFGTALAVSAILLAGYFYLRNRHQQRVAASAPVVNTTAPVKGPTQVHVLIDDPMLKGGETIIGGTVKNVSAEELSGLSVDLELRRRSDGEIETRAIPLEPPTLGPQQEGRYAIKLPAQEYRAVRLMGLRDDDSKTVAHSSSQGQRRPLEKTESKTIVVQRPAPRGGEEFLNTPDNPGRVP